MEKLRFQTRIYLGYALLSIFTILLFAFALFELNKTKENIEEIYNHPFVVSNSIKDVKLNIITSTFSVHSFLEAESLDVSQEALKEIKAYDSVCLIHYEKIKNGFLGPKADFENAFSAYKDFKNTRNRIIELKNSGSIAEARLLNNNDSRQQLGFLLKKMEVLSDFTSNEATSLYEKANNSLKSDRLIFTWVTVGLFILGFLVSYFISKSITKPINYLLQELRSINTEENILPDNEALLKSEQELIYDVVADLKSVYSKLNIFNLELEKKVEFRTRELQESKLALIKTNEKLTKEKEKAEYNEKLKSAFLANMSHEIRTPMNAILGFSNLLKEHDLEKEKKQKFINLIQDSGKRLLSIISDIVDISKINAKQLTVNISVCNLNEIVDSLHFQFSLYPKAKQLKIKVVKALNDNDCFIKTDKNRLFQILSNLIENALRFTNEGSVTFGYKIESETIQFFVEDTGIGIAPEYRKVVFDRFSQVQNENIAEKGNGLGLSIAKGLVELLKGEIWIESNTPKGAKFLFIIPYVPVVQNNTYSVITKDAISVLEIERKTIMIVEDENSNFIYLREVIKNFNINIIRAHNGLEAVDFFKKNPQIDFIFMDIKMPVMDGYQATMQLREINSTVPIIALTAYVYSEDEAQAMVSGCNEYVAKPVSKQKIEELLSKYFKTLSQGHML